jgi:hypothetical protein
MSINILQTLIGALTSAKTAVAATPSQSPAMSNFMQDVDSLLNKAPQVLEDLAVEGVNAVLAAEAATNPLFAFAVTLEPTVIDPIVRQFAKALVGEFIKPKSEPATTMEPLPDSPAPFVQPVSSLPTY